MTGQLQRQHSGRWAIVNGDDSRELTSGSVIEVEIGGHWIQTSIEYAHGSRGGDYYATTKGIALVNGLAARLPQR